MALLPRIAQRRWNSDPSVRRCRRCSFFLLLLLLLLCCCCCCSPASLELHSAHRARCDHGSSRDAGAGERATALPRPRAGRPREGSLQRASLRHATSSAVRVACLPSVHYDKGFTSPRPSTPRRLQGGTLVGTCVEMLEAVRGAVMFYHWNHGRSLHHQRLGWLLSGGDKMAHATICTMTWCGRLG